MDDKYIYFSNWLHGDIRQYDITDSRYVVYVSLQETQAHWTSFLGRFHTKERTSESDQRQRNIRNKFVCNRIGIAMLIQIIKKIEGST